MSPETLPFLVTPHTSGAVPEGQWRRSLGNCSGHQCAAAGPTSLSLLESPGGPDAWSSQRLPCLRRDLSTSGERWAPGARASTRCCLCLPVSTFQGTSLSLSLVSSVPVSLAPAVSVLLVASSRCPVSGFASSRTWQPGRTFQKVPLSLERKALVPRVVAVLVFSQGLQVPASASFQGQAWYQTLHLRCCTFPQTHSAECTECFRAPSSRSVLTSGWHTLTGVGDGLSGLCHMGRAAEGRKASGREGGGRRSHGVRSRGGPRAF